VAGLATTFGSGAMTNPISDIDNEVELMFLIGTNPTEAHPIIGYKMRQAARRGAKLEEELQNWSQVSQQQLYVDFTACNNYDVSQQVGDIKMPVLILVGDQDKMTPIKSSQYLQEKIGGSVLQIVPGAGHHLMLEKPAETISAISGFLKASFSRQD
jgi:pimeloyl-ACP methyl ester carboxylesterase